MGKIHRYAKLANELPVMKKTEGTEWLCEVNSQSLQQSLQNLDIAYKNFFNKTAKLPTFKNKYSKQSFRVPANAEILDGKLVIPKFQEGIECVVHRPMEGTVAYATVSKTTRGHYYVSMTCSVETVEQPKTGAVVGIDFGINRFASLSDRTSVKNPRFFKRASKRVASLQRKHARSKSGSKNRDAIRLKLAGAHAHVANQRKDFIHKFTTDVIKNHDVVCLESLDVKGMIEDGSTSLSREISDAAWSETMRQLEYKAEWYGKIVVHVDQYFPSSKLCNACKFKMLSLPLEIRSWICPHCGQVHDRDFNAADNILEEGLRILSSGVGTSSDVKQIDGFNTIKSVKEAPESLAQV